jgi:RNA polymerase sigma factor (sigma-70 family)
MTPVLSDDRLALRATKGDERAFAAIFDRYHQDLYRFCLAIVGNPQDAQDALQNAMVKVLRALPGEKRRIQLKPWLYRIVHNESVELLRRRRDSVELEPELTTSGIELAETAATRERLRRLFDDLAELSERQRAALVMRELSGLDFAQIGTAFDTSDAVARQTVYEARVSLRQMEEGREMNCANVMRQLSGADGRVARRREIKAHLRACRSCREFRESIAGRRHDFAAIAPLPLALSAGLLQGVLGSNGAAAASAGAGSAATGGVAGTVAAGAGKTAATSIVAKSVAAVAVTAIVGVGAADRGGLIETPLPSSIGGAKSLEQPASTTPPGPVPASAGATGTRDAQPVEPGKRDAGEAKGKAAPSGRTDDDSPGRAAPPASGNGRGRPEGPPGRSGKGPATPDPGKSGGSSGAKGQSAAKGSTGSRGQKPNGGPPRSAPAKGSNSSAGSPSGAGNGAFKQPPVQGAPPKGPPSYPTGSTGQQPAPPETPSP